ncbi:phosphotransferase [Actinopolymorpha sp. B9G3]|uniref:phosphotransferase family protein n=1 Tax=Actinopolymorpha sp. B9G3 TaxID=3158970 RepID=UPI0032D96EA4
MDLRGDSRRDALVAIADRYHIAIEDIVPAPAPGAANYVYFLGDHLVVRIPRGGGARLAELAKEATVIPAARRAGVRTPAVVTYDDSCSVVGVPYLVIERVRGRDLGALGVSPTEAAGAYRQVGLSLARLHRLVRGRVGPLPGLGVDDESDPRPTVEALAEVGYVDVDAARWLIGWFDRLARWRPADVEPVVVHGDAAPTNIVVASDLELLGPGADRGVDGVFDTATLVDWGDAAWADPAVDFAKIPLRAVPFALEGYLAGVGARSRAEALQGWAARILWYHLSWALHGAPQEPRTDERTWTAPPLSRLLEVLRFFAQSPPEPWASLA